MPASLAQIYPSASDLCWRGCGQRGMLLHIWWECHQIRHFWTAIRDCINEVLEVDLPLQPAHFLLHVPTVPLIRYRCSILPHLLNTAKRLVLIHWKSAHVPSREDSIQKVKEIMEAKAWISTSNSRPLSSATCPSEPTNLTT